MGTIADILGAPPGLLNDFRSAGIDAQTVDPASENYNSLQARTIINAFTPNTLRSITRIKGWVLKVEPSMPLADTAKPTWIKTLEATGMTPNLDLSLLRVRIYIPELFNAPLGLPAELPASENYSDFLRLSDLDRNKINATPVFTAKDTMVSNMSVRPGDLVWCTFGNPAALSDPIYLGPVIIDSATLSSASRRFSPNCADRSKGLRTQQSSGDNLRGGDFAPPAPVSPGAPIPIQVGRQDPPPDRNTGWKKYVYYLYERQLQFANTLQQYWTPGWNGDGRTGVDKIKKLVYFVANKYGTTPEQQTWLAKTVYGVMFTESKWRAGCGICCRQNPARATANSYGMAQIKGNRFAAEKRIDNGRTDHPANGPNITWEHYDLLDPYIAIETLTVSYKRCWRKWSRGNTPPSPERVGKWWAGGDPSTGSDYRRKMRTVVAKGPEIETIGALPPLDAAILAETKELINNRPLPLYITYDQWQNNVAPTPETINPNYGLTPDGTNMAGTPPNSAAHGAASPSNNNVAPYSNPFASTNTPPEASVEPFVMPPRLAKLSPTEDVTFEELDPFRGGKFSSEFQRQTPTPSTTTSRRTPRIAACPPQRRSRREGEGGGGGGTGQISPLTTKAMYDEHIQEQLRRFRTKMPGPSLSSTKSTHKGVNNMILGGRNVATGFKVIRWDGTVPGFERAIDSNGTKRWWDAENPSSKSSARGAGLYPSGNPSLREPSQVTHVTIHNIGTSVRPCNAPGDCAVATRICNAFNGRGFLAQLLVDKHGQIYQICDPLYRTAHVGGGGLASGKTSPNRFSIGIELLSGVPRQVAGQNLANQAVIDAPDGHYHMRRYNLDRPGDVHWGRPIQQFMGYKAEHEALWKLVEFLSRNTGIELKVAAMDARLDAGMMRGPSRIQSHYQLQSGGNGRTDGQSFIFWCMAHNKGNLIEATDFEPGGVA